MQWADCFDFPESLIDFYKNPAYLFNLTSKNNQLHGNSWWE